MKLERRHWNPLLLLIVLFAFALRVYQLDDFAFWQDEGLTTLRSGYAVGEILSNRITIQEGVTKDTHPPAYYLIAHYGRILFGRSDFSYRYTSVLFGVLLVPLLFQLGRRLNGMMVGMLAAVLAALNPLQVWYAREARMYTMLVFLGAAASYVLWRALTEPRISTRGLVAKIILYFFLAGLAFYTHYTAIFLIVAQGLFWIWLLWRRGLRLVIIGAGLAAVLVAIPLIPVTIPRLFSGAETAYQYVAPWIMLQDVVHGFGQGISSNFSQPGIKLLDLGILLLLFVGLLFAQRVDRNSRLSRVFLLIYLLAAVLGLMAGSLLKPMYLGVRHIIIGSPAFIILAARSVSALPRKPLHLGQIAALVVLLGGSLIALVNLYYDPTYAKDDVRSLVEHIETRAGDNDVVLYNNAILLPLHEHYRQRKDLPVSALPVYPYSAAESDYEELSELTRKYDRIWFVVDPPIDARDSSGLVSGWLDNNLPLIETANFWSVSMLNKVAAYDAGPVYLEVLPDEAITLNTTREEIPELLSSRLVIREPVVLPTLWLDLFWEVVEVPDPELKVRFALRDEEGDLWFDYSQSARLVPEPPRSGSAAERVSYGLGLPPGIPPGEYELLAQVWKGTDQTPRADWIPLFEVEIAPSDQWPQQIDWPFEDASSLTFDDVLILHGMVPASPEVRPGHTLPISFYWQAGESTEHLSNLHYRLEVVGPDGEVLTRRTQTPGPDWLAPDQWPEDAIILERSGLFVPADAPTGRYVFNWQLLSGEETIPGSPAWRPWSQEQNTAGSIQVVPWPLETTLPESGELIQASFGPAIELYAYDLEPIELAPGESVDLTLYWRATGVPDQSYRVFVHLIDPQDDVAIAQSDRVPADWLRPTNGWRSGEIITDHHRLELSTDAEAGEYHLFVGLYNPESSLRVPVEVEGEQQPDDRLFLDSIQVVR